MFATSLKDILRTELQGRKLLSYNDVKEICETAVNPRTGHHYKLETGTRRLRMEDDSIPCVKLNFKKKPIVGSEAWVFIKWAGSKTVINRM